MEGPATGSEQLDLIATGLEEAGWAAFILDSDWRFVWVSSELRALVGESEPDRLGLGEHTVVAQGLPAWDLFDPEFDRDFLLFRISLILADSDKGPDELVELAAGVLARPQHRAHADAIRDQIRALSRWTGPHGPTEAWRRDSPGWARPFNSQHASEIHKADSWAWSSSMWPISRRRYRTP